MKASSLEHKTVRPGLLAYSFYSSGRKPSDQRPLPVKMSPAKSFGLGRGLLLAMILGIVGVLLYDGFKAIVLQQSNNVVTHTTPRTNAGAAVLPATTPCTGNILPTFIKVSINQRHLWACQAASVVYSSPVITGMENFPADKTPTGTYHIYAKITNTTLTGADSTGTWSDPVNYWMPFLNNQYGTYGFHDATWRPDSAFGHIDPSSNQASHGCVEMPLAASKWLYNWVSIGTTLVIES